MKQLLALRWTSIVGAWLSLALATGCSDEVPVAKLPPSRVTVQQPQTREVTDFDTYNGHLDASQTVEIRARVSGYLNKVHFAAGDRVEQGTVLFEIDPRQFQAEVDRAVADVARWQAELARTTANLARAQKLRPTAAITQEEFDRQVAEHDVAKASLEAAQAALAQAELNLGFTKVTAPIGGILSRTLITEGNLVNADITALTRLTSITPFYCYFDVDERSLQRYQKRARDTGRPEATEPLAAAKIPFEFALETETGFPHHGVLDFADNKVDPNTGTIQVRGVTENKFRNLVAGERVRARVPVSDPYQALLIPDEAVLADQSKRYVLVVGPGNIVLRREVNLGRLLDDGMRVVLPAASDADSLRPDDHVIVLGMQSARVNYPAEPVDAAGRPLARVTVGSQQAETQSVERQETE
ncbi:MAG: efflux RND transporter periplasmic adaptor subunit [Pirellulales bacterium]|nr:efflux RND transporter periplasmic adaptor subunit [Pirellulales bacterium]